MSMPGAEVKIGAKNEILVRGPMVMRSYYKMPEETKTFDEHGFLKTGDAGHFDENGNLFITDRIKELMKTSGGKYIAPQVVEGAIGKITLSNRCCYRWYTQIRFCADCPCCWLARRVCPKNWIYQVSRPCWAC